MKYATGLLAFAASVLAQDLVDSLAQKFEIVPRNQTEGLPGKTTLPQCTTNPIVTLKDTVLTDQQGRQAEIVANYQFQFDPADMLQSGRKAESGFQYSSGSNVLALNGNTTFYGCKSGSFSNLYSQPLGLQCYPVYFQVVLCDGTSSGASSEPATSAPATSATSAPATFAPATSAPATSAASTPSTTTSATFTSLPAPAIPVSTSAAPYPTGNATTPAASGTGSPSSTAPGSTTSAPLTAPASGASTLAIGAKFGAVVAAVAAFAML